MPLIEHETIPITVGGKQVAAVTIMYHNDGWSAHLLISTKSEHSSVLLQRGTELIGKERAVEIALALADKWRDAQRT
jgi:hypothetical protein